MSLGLPKGQNYLVPHDLSWRRQFEEERRRLRAVLGADASDIQHIGSTAVPGIHAKPIVDIVVAARSHTLADDWQDAMASLGYDYPGDIGIPGTESTDGTVTFGGSLCTSWMRMVCN